ncbi:16S rRNA (cytosine(1402)-N(4))-methyltransferase [Halalkalibacillus sediminis]|uniref:16S rRNA (Cytosine(1402)-N(4))-methyltransferase n=1 Tax=Halalkalibacillus sediminis TaxID=2018042 RepID=A0A2I0QV04_9BACI|nr:class I SAM-dependent methyltransferase [Halalkalibacillus sediminis]PKR78148.1 16S rRNA (cytosine(1402)-N(4))-methyltransferase [Halalkalibacillus sediminis]
MKSIIPLAHSILEESLREGDIVVDATLGNGHDSLFLSKIVRKEGAVYGFDIQEEAILQSKKLFQQEDAQNIYTFNIGHENAADLLKQKEVESIDGVIFNLGYLPGGDHTVTTLSRTTIIAFNDLFELLKPNKYIVFVVYPGHEQGNHESDSLVSHLSKIPAKDADIAKYQMVNRSEAAPYVIAVFKK